MVILFDGACNLCNGFVRFVIKRDKKKVFKFASLQSAYGASVLEHFHLNTQEFDTMLVYDGKNLLTRSEAVITVLNSLGGIWKLSLIYKIFPGFMRNALYNSIAKRRYKLFGKRDNCMVPSPELKDRFLDDSQLFK